MTTAIERVTNSLQKLKSLGDGKETLAQRDQIVTQMRIDLTSF